MAYLLNSEIKGNPMGPSSAVAGASLSVGILPSALLCVAPIASRRAPRTIKVRRASSIPYAQPWHCRGDEEFFLRPPVGRSMEYGLSCSAQIRKMGEVRYNSLMKTFPQEAEELFVATERNAKLRYEGYKKLSEL